MFYSSHLLCADLEDRADRVRAITEGNFCHFSYAGYDPL
jgi:hypothetical protein